MLKAKITPRYLVDNLHNALMTGMVPMIWGSPGTGKSASIAQLANDYNLELLDIRVSMFEPVDFSGLPTLGADKATYLPFDTLPLEGDPLPEGKDGWLIFFDEINHGKKSTVAAMYQVLLDKKIGKHKIHPNVVMIAAGNGMDDRALVEIMSTATKSRLCNLYMEPSVNEWIEDVAMKNGYSPAISAYLNMYPMDFYDFNPEADQDSFSCPRSWSMTNRYMDTIERKLDSSDLPIISGLLSPDVATKFVTFVKLIDYMPKIEDIIKEPKDLPLPEEHDLNWAVTTYSVEAATKENVKALLTYISRMGKTFLILFLRMLFQKDISFASLPDVIEVQKDIGNFLFER